MIDFEAGVREAWLDATAPGCVLVVSENEVIRTGLRLLLQRNRYEVVEARTAYTPATVFPRMFCR